MNPHDQLGVWESMRGTTLKCADCGKAAEGNCESEDGPVCDACVAADEKGGE